MRSASALLIITLTPLAGLQAQRMAEPAFLSIEPPAIAVPKAEAEPVSTVWLVTGGVLSGAAAGLGGMYSGALLTGGDCEDCAIVGAVYGLVGGISAGIPLGVHFTNGSKGNLARSMAASLAIGGVGLGVALATDEPAILFGIPVLQLASSIAIERRAG